MKCALKFGHSFEEVRQKYMDPLFIPVKKGGYFFHYA